MMQSMMEMDDLSFIGRDFGMLGYGHDDAMLDPHVDQYMPAFEGHQQDSTQGDSHAPHVDAAQPHPQQHQDHDAENMLYEPYGYEHTAYQPYGYEQPFVSEHSAYEYPCETEPTTYPRFYFDEQAVEQERQRQMKQQRRAAAAPSSCVPTAAQSAATPIALSGSSKSVVAPSSASASMHFSTSPMRVRSSSLVDKYSKLTDDELLVEERQAEKDCDVAKHKHRKGTMCPRCRVDQRLKQIRRIQLKRTNAKFRPRPDATFSQVGGARRKKARRATEPSTPTSTSAPKDQPTIQPPTLKYSSSFSLYTAGRTSSTMRPRVESQGVATLAATLEECEPVEFPELKGRGQALSSFSI